MPDNGIYSFEDLRRKGQAVPISVVEGLLRQTEPIEVHLLNTDGSSEVRVTLPEGWNEGIKDLDDSLLTSCTISFKGGKTTYRLTKRAMLTILGKIGISDRYAYKAPGPLLEPHLNYWFAHEGVGGKPTVNLLTKDDYAVAVMDSAVPVVSNLTVLEQVKAYLKTNLKQTDLYIDPNVVNGFMETDFRIILPKVQFEVETTRNGVPQVDKWHFGVHVTNSLIATSAKPLTLAGFMVEQRSLTGILPEYSQITSFTKTADMDPDFLKGWVKSALDQIFAILPAEAELVQALPQHGLSGKISSLTTDIFRSMKIHRKVQEISLNNLIEEGDMTAYGLMMALGYAVSPASPTKFSHKVTNHVQRVAGTLPSRSEDVCDGCGRMHLMD